MTCGGESVVNESTTVWRAAADQRQTWRCDGFVVRERDIERNAEQRELQNVKKK
ncbi:hypothetical protein A2U01_0079549, partial [Trifolium medium]|nr:hypothetical protein [Trifolium medium]